MTNKHPDTHMTQIEAANYLRTTTMSIYRWERRNKFPKRVEAPEGVFGNFVYYLKKDVEAFKRKEWENPNG